MFAVCNAELAGPPALFKEKLLKLAIRQNGRTIMATSWNLAAEIRSCNGARYNFAICIEEENSRLWQMASRRKGIFARELADSDPPQYFPDTLHHTLLTSSAKCEGKP